MDLPTRPCPQYGRQPSSPRKYHYIQVLELAGPSSMSSAIAAVPEIGARLDNPESGAVLHAAPRTLDSLPPPPNPIPRKTDRDRSNQERAAGQNVAGGESRAEYIAQESRAGTEQEGNRGG